MFKFLILFLITLLSACSSGSQSIPQIASERYSQMVHPQPQATGTCPGAALFIRIGIEIRGYDNTKTGSTTACSDIVGAATNLYYSGNGLLATSGHGNIHTVDFQPNVNAFHIYAAATSGNTAPIREAGSMDRDAHALTVEQNGTSPTDYIVSGTSPTEDCYYVILANATSPSTTKPCDTHFSTINAMATTSSNSLVLVGVDASNGQGRIDYLTNTKVATPTISKTIEGSLTGLTTATSFAVTIDQSTNTLYVYSSDETTPKVSEFSSTASGNVAPTTVISGSNTKFPSSVYNQSIIGLDTNHNLYVNETGVTNNYATFAEFNSGVSGNVSPNRTFYDSSFSDQVFGSPDVGSMAVRLTAS